MRVVLDTNVLVSGLMTGEGPCGQIIRLLGGAAVEPCFDERIFAAYEAVLPRPQLRLDREEVAAMLQIIRRRGRPLISMPSAIELPDPTDLPFLEVAASADAILVTGNARHFPARARAGVTVMSPSEFLDHLRGSS